MCKYTIPFLRYDGIFKKCGINLNYCHFQEMFATSIKGLHDRFDALDKAILALSEKQDANEKKLEEIASKVSGKRVRFDNFFQMPYWHINKTIFIFISLIMHNFFLSFLRFPGLST